MHSASIRKMRIQEDEPGENGAPCLCGAPALNSPCRQSTRIKANQTQDIFDRAAGLTLSSLQEEGGEDRRPVPRSRASRKVLVRSRLSALPAPSVAIDHPIAFLILSSAQTEIFKNLCARRENRTSDRPYVHRDCVLRPCGSAAKIEYVMPIAIDHARARLSQPAVRSSRNDCRARRLRAPPHHSITPPIHHSTNPLIH
jgi:hypothetical protein